MARTRKSPMRLWTASLERFNLFILPNFLIFMSSAPSDQHRHRPDRYSGVVDLVTSEGARPIGVQEHQDVAAPHHPCVGRGPISGRYHQVQQTVVIDVHRYHALDLGDACAVGLGGDVGYRPYWRRHSVFKSAVCLIRSTRHQPRCDAHPRRPRPRCPASCPCSCSCRW